MRPIDADALKNKFIEWLPNIGNEPSIHPVENIAVSAIMEIEDAPTIDPVHAAGACYCRECEYFYIDEGDSLGVCRNDRLVVSNRGEICPLPNFYCPYGKQKIEE